MTAEIAVINREAVALASDSAVTTIMPGGQKIFTSAEKIFQLAERYPVGIMFYNNAYFMGIPWHTIIKIYKSKIPAKGYPKLKDYASSFIEFLEHKFVPYESKTQEGFIDSFLYNYFIIIIKDIFSDAEKLIEKRGSVSSNQATRLVSKNVKRHLQFWEEFKFKNKSSMSLSLAKKITRTYKAIINSTISHSFQNLPISIKTKRNILSLCSLLLAKGISPNGSTGIVIAGLGEAEIFPSVQCFTVDGVVNNTLRHFSGTSRGAGINTDGSIVAFAQKEMVQRFMEGVDPLYSQKQSELMYELPEKFTKHVGSILNKYGNIPKSRRSSIIEQLIKLCSETVDYHNKEMSKFAKEKFERPVTDLVTRLPKTELAILAESLVNITSIKRRFSLESETVAEPIDVVLISKSDGFVWVKKKELF